MIHNKKYSIPQWYLYSISIIFSFIFLIFVSSMLFTDTAVKTSTLTTCCPPFCLLLLLFLWFLQVCCEWEIITVNWLIWWRPCTCTVQQQCMAVLRYTHGFTVQLNKPSHIQFFFFLFFFLNNLCISILCEFSGTL